MFWRTKDSTEQTVEFICHSLSEKHSDWKFGENDVSKKQYLVHKNNHVHLAWAPNLKTGESLVYFCLTPQKMQGIDISKSQAKKIDKAVKDWKAVETFNQLL